LRELAEKARAEKENLENLLREREVELEGHKKEIETLKMEKEHLNHKVSEVLLLKHKKCIEHTLLLILSLPSLLFLIDFICCII
jgi:hypothetical protein